MDSVKVLLIRGTGALQRIETLLEKDNGTVFYIVEWAESLEAAYRALVRNNYDIYILGHNVADTNLSGIELAERANSGGCVSPIILVTHQADDDVDWAAEEAGLAAYLHRDLDLTERTLKRTISYARRHYRKLQEIQSTLALLQTQLADLTRKINAR